MGDKVTLVVGNIQTQIRGRLPKDVKVCLDEDLSFLVQGYMFSPKFKKGHWDGRKHFFSRRTYKFPTGLIGRCREILEDFGIDYEHKDERPKPIERSPTPLPFRGITLFSYQEEAVEIALRITRGVIRAPCGFGKTEVILKIVSELNAPTNIFVHRTPLFYQMANRLKSRCGADAGRIGDGKFIPRKINVVMIQTAHDNPRVMAVLRQAAVNIYDECQIIPTDSLYNVHREVRRSTYLLGLSATPWRDDGNDMYIEAAVGPIIYSKTASELINIGRLSPVDIVFIHVNKTTKRDRFEPYADFYDRTVVFNSKRTAIVATIVRWLFSKKKTVLITVRRIPHGEAIMHALEVMCPDVKKKFVKGELDSAEKFNTLEELNERKWDVVVATTIYDIGIDVPTLDCLINVRSSASSVGTYQLVGRVLRTAPGKEQALVIDLADDCKWLDKHWKAREKILKTEPAFNIKHVHEIENVIPVLKETF